MLKSINPHSLHTLKEYTEDHSQSIEHKIDTVYKAAQLHAQTSFDQRSDSLNRLAQTLQSNMDIYAQLMADEMGKPLLQGRAEIKKCIWVCEYYAEHGPQFLQDFSVITEAKKSFVTYQPLGVVLGIMPWNFPFWQVFRFLAPTIMAGNTALLKHASNVSECSLRIEAMVSDCSPEHPLLQSLLIGSKNVEPIIADPRISAVTFTGSTQAGKAVAKIAGQHLKKTILELGGNDPYIILEDADLDLAAQKCLESRMNNAGQSCIAAKRFLLLEPIADAFIELVLKYIQAYSFGDPSHKAYALGPLARLDLRDELHQQVQQSIALGAKTLTGAYLPDQVGAYYPPTLLDHVQPGMPAFDDELFGPVASLVRCQNETDAIALANHSAYGLGSAVFSKNIERAHDIARNKIHAGSCFINDYVQSDPRLPFGGIKHSGYGRELSHFGIQAFVNIKTVSQF